MSIYTFKSDGTRVRISPAPGEAPGEVEVIEGEDAGTTHEVKLDDEPKADEVVEKKAPARSSKAAAPAVTDKDEEKAS